MTRFRAALLRHSPNFRPIPNKRSDSLQENKLSPQAWRYNGDEGPGRRRRGADRDIYGFEDLFDMINMLAGPGGIAGAIGRNSGTDFEDIIAKKRALRNYEDELSRIRDRRNEADRLERERTERLAEELAKKSRYNEYLNRSPSKKEIEIDLTPRQQGDPADYIPRLHKTEDIDGYRYTLDVQGLGRDELKLSMQDNIVIVEGSTMVKTSDGYHSNTFKRSFALPMDADLNSVRSSELNDGLLLIQAKKATQGRPERELKIERIPSNKDQSVQYQPPSPTEMGAQQEPQISKIQTSVDNRQASPSVTDDPPAISKSVTEEPSVSDNLSPPTDYAPPPPPPPTSKNLSPTTGYAPPEKVTESEKGVDELLSLGRKATQGQAVEEPRRVMARDGWEKVAGAWVKMPPKGTEWKAVVHFTGGAFASILPKLTYGSLLERLANRGVLIIATPYATGFDYNKCVREAFQMYADASEELSYDIDPVSGKSVRSLPVFGVGHSLGSVVQLLGGSTESYAMENRKGNILMSFNNRPASESVPMIGKTVGQEMSANGMGSLAPMVEQMLENPEMLNSEMGSQVNMMINMLLQNPSQLAQMTPMLEMFGISPDQLDEILPALRQIQVLSADMSAGINEFKPTREEIQNLVTQSYPTKRNLLIQFTEDSIDETPALEAILSSISDGVQRVAVPGGHTKPIVLNMKKAPSELESQFPGTQAEMQSSRSMSSVLAERDMDYLADIIMDFIDERA
eukprot:CAMPEP_0184479466 /NCGR_PEP_ID=MMETSP0113_2-20130426/1182_1 /TAXON_ID=91329 /ORGANISM="Norrisiella sphaerica, Strain BC52" /LENGTH=740 /DNA_ID=CAMNT_0026857559 /DNA_START=1481 /DNA_END=3703 /DNA_ORIENTATION=-